MFCAFVLLFILFTQANLQAFVTQGNDVEADRVQANSLFDMSLLNSDFALYSWQRSSNRIFKLSWSLSNHYGSNGSAVFGADNDIGWKSTTEINSPYLWSILFRDQNITAVEGNLTCTSTKDGATVQVGIYYPIISLTAIQNIEGSGTFKVVCISSGGRPLRMSVSGPSGVVEDNMNIVNVGGAVGTGNDSFTSNTTVHDGRNGDTYTCFASNGISNMSNSLTLGDGGSKSSSSSHPTTPSDNSKHANPRLDTTTPTPNVRPTRPSSKDDSSESPFQSPVGILIVMAFLLVGIIIGVTITLSTLTIFKRCRKYGQTKVKAVVEQNPAYGVSLGLVDSAKTGPEYEHVEF